MNEQDPKDQDPVIRQTLERLNQWEQQVDAVQAAKLSAARRRALSPQATAAWRNPWLGGAVAASLALAVFMGLPQRKDKPLGVEPQLSAQLAADAAFDELLEDDLLDADLDMALALSGLDDRS